jgi:muramoyltetrapeptide carboxypeptidase
MKHTSEEKSSASALDSRSSLVVGAYSPSGTFLGGTEKERLFESGIQHLKSLGFGVRLAPNYDARWHYMAGAPEVRAESLRTLLRDPDVDVIIPIIGGHAAAQMLSFLDFEEIAASGKAFCGFSDNAILPLIVTAKTNAVTYHTLCDLTFGFGRMKEGGLRLTETSFIDAIRNKRFDLNGTQSAKTLVVGEVEGVLLGGNLKGISMLVGTPYAPDWTGKVMFWESADPPHAVLQQLVHLKNAGVLDSIAGMIVGKYSTLRESFYDAADMPPLQTFFADVLESPGYPIVVEADIGHNIDNVTIPLGRRVRVRATPDSVSIEVIPI